MSKKNLVSGGSEDYNGENDLQPLDSGVEEETSITHETLSGETEIQDKLDSAPESLVPEDNLVNEMQEIKHAYKEGVKAQQGIEW